MKTRKSIKFLSSFVCLLGLTVIFSSVFAQEYDDMYFTKSDRKTVKVDKATVVSADKNQSNTNYKEISKTTETYSAKNVNPEYIARYKSPESNEVAEEAAQKSDSYTSEDYFVEGYEDTEYISDAHKNDVDYVALAKRDQMSYSNTSNSFSSPSWRFSPYMSMGMGMGSPYYGGYGYDPYGMGYGSGMSMGMGFGSGFGYSPSMSYSVGMSWGTGYNPWGGGYPGYYSPYGRRGFNDPWRSSSMYGYNSYNSIGCTPFNSNGYGGYGSSAVAMSSNSDALHGVNSNYKPRTTRVAASQRNVSRSNTDNLRVASSNAKIRVADRNISAAASNGRVSKDYSKVQNEYYNSARRNSSATNRISSSSPRRSSYNGSSSSASKYSSSITNNKPSRSSSFTSGSNRSNSNNSSSYSGKSSGASRSSSSSSFSTPSRNSYSSGSSSGSSSYSSGSSRSSSSGSSRSSSSSSRSGR